MDENKLEILKMIRDGRITPEEGLELLQAIGEATAASKQAETPKQLSEMDDAQAYAFTVGEENETAQDTGSETGPKKKPRFLIIQVSQGGKKKVNVKIPLKLAKLASRFIPKSAQAHMKAEGVELDLKELISGIEECGCGEDLINVADDEKDETVRIFCC